MPALERNKKSVGVRIAEFAQLQKRREAALKGGVKMKCEKNIGGASSRRKRRLSERLVDYSAWELRRVKKLGLLGRTSERQNRVSGNSVVSENGLLSGIAGDVSFSDDAVSREDTFVEQKQLLVVACDEPSTSMAADFVDENKLLVVAAEKQSGTVVAKNKVIADLLNDHESTGLECKKRKRVTIKRQVTMDSYVDREVDENWRNKFVLTSAASASESITDPLMRVAAEYTNLYLKQSLLSVKSVSTTPQVVNVVPLFDLTHFNKKAKFEFRELKYRCHVRNYEKFCECQQVLKRSREHNRADIMFDVFLNHDFLQLICFAGCGTGSGCKPFLGSKVLLSSLKY